MTLVSKIFAITMAVFSLASCEKVSAQSGTGTSAVSSQSDVSAAAEDTSSGHTEETEKNDLMPVLSINNKKIDVEWENNDSVRALAELAEKGDVTSEMSMYGGFEQVGSLGTSLPRNDKQTTTAPGDIVLYSGSNIVVFYGSNSWSYTRLGRITGMTESELAGLLGSGDVTLTISSSGK